VQRIRAPPVEITHDRDFPHVRPKEFELHYTFPGNTCHIALPFVTMPFQSMCQRAAQRVWQTSSLGILPANLASIFSQKSQICRSPE